MQEESGYNLTILSSELKDQFKHKMAANTMEKCHASCMISLDESKLLAHEEACFRNCFVKSAQFNKHFENEMKYTLRQFNKAPKDE